MSKQWYRSKWGGLFFLAISLMALGLSSHRVFADATSCSGSTTPGLVQSCSGDVSIAGSSSIGNATTDNRQSYYQMESPKTGSPTTVTITVNPTCGSGIGFDIYALSGGSVSSNNQYPDICYTGSGKSVNVSFTMQTGSNCTADPSSNNSECVAEFYIQADSPVSGGAGHFPYLLTVNGQADIAHDASADGGKAVSNSPDQNGWPANTTIPSGERQFGLQLSNPSFSFTVPCNVPNGTKVWLAWSGVDYDSSAQPISAGNVGFTVNGSGGESDYQLGGANNDTAVYSYPLTVSGGQTYTWSWYGIYEPANDGNEVVFSLPYTQNSFNLNEQCGTPKGNISNINVCASQVTLDGYMSNDPNGNVNFQVVNPGGFPVASGTTNGKKDANGNFIMYTYGASLSSTSYNKTFYLQILEPPGDGGQWATVDHMATPNSGPAPPCNNSTTPEVDATCKGTYAYTDTVAPSQPQKYDSTTGGWDTIAPPTISGASTASGYTEHWDLNASDYSNSDVIAKTIVNVSNVTPGVSGSVGNSASDPSTDSTSQNWQYAPTTPSISIQATYQEYGLMYWYYKQNAGDKSPQWHENTDSNWRYYQGPDYATPTSIPCYTATIANSGSCSLSISGLTDVDGTYIVVAGQQLIVSGTLYNPPDPGNPYQEDLPASVSGMGNLNINSNGEHDVGGVPIGGSASTSWTIQATPGSPSYQTISAAPYYGTTALPGPSGVSPSCSISFPVYAPFTLTPGASVNLSPTVEDPDTTDGVQNQAWVSENGPPVSETVTANLTATTAKCGNYTTDSPQTNSGPFTSTTYLFPPGGSAGSTYDYNPCSSPLTAGDTYCATITVPDTTYNGNQAYVGPQAGDSTIVGGTADTVTACQTVQNRPFFKVYNSGVTAGGSFDSTCSGGGTLAGWNNDSGTYPNYDFGAGAQLHASAPGGIVGFASDQDTDNARNNSPLGLTFANTVHNSGSGTDGTAYSPNLGGKNGVSINCLPTKSAPTSGTTTVTSDNWTTSGNYTGSGNVTLGDGRPVTIAQGNNVNIYVKGNVYIDSNIIYGGEGSWGITGASTPPSFSLYATGNIYIDPGVTELEGSYVAGSSGSNGNIYTCGQDNGGTFSEVALGASGSPAYSTCYHQLTVYGNFVADNVDMLRTYGSLRDETPNPGTSADSFSIAGRNYFSCRPTGHNFDGVNLPCDSYGNPGDGSVYDMTDYTATYNLRNKQSGAYRVDLNYKNYEPSGGGNWPPPSGGNYRYEVQVAVNGVYRTTWRLPFGGSALNYRTSLNLPAANSTITLTWDNNIWIDSNGNAEPASDTTPPPGAYDPNLQIDFFSGTLAGTPPTAKNSLTCSNAYSGNTNGSNNNLNLTATCAAEVFYLDPAAYLSSGNTCPVSDTTCGPSGTPPADAITSLPPVL